MSGIQFSEAEFRSRIERLRTAMRERGAEVMIIDDAEILAYFTGYERSVSFYRACFVPFTGEPFMVLRSLDIAPFREKSWIETCIGYPDTIDAVTAMASELEARGFASASIGFDSGSHAMTVATFSALQAALPKAQFIAMKGVPWELRLIKSEQEIAYTRRACEIADQSVRDIAAAAKPGVSERDMAALAAHRYITMGGDPGHVGPITSGKGWGFLHGHLHDRPLENGDILHLELVPRFNCYSARLMRSIIIGAPSAEQSRNAAELCEAQDLQLAAMKPGVKASEIDEILRREVLSRGLRESYDNITGYTLGYYSQQPLRSSDFTRVFNPDADWTLEAGMLFHMYTSARGLAFSETVRVTETGAERLTQIERKLFATA